MAKSRSSRYEPNLAQSWIVAYWLLLDWASQIQIRRSHPKLPAGGAETPTATQATNGATIQDWYVIISKLGETCISFAAVKPDATPEEVRSVVNDDSGGQIFQQAVSTSHPKRKGQPHQMYSS